MKAIAIVTALLLVLGFAAVAQAEYSAPEKWHGGVTGEEAVEQGRGGIETGETAPGPVISAPDKWDLTEPEDTMVCPPADMGRGGVEPRVEKTPPARDDFGSKWNY